MLKPANTSCSTVHIVIHEAPSVCPCPFVMAAAIYNLDQKPCWSADGNVGCLQGACLFLRGECHGEVEKRERRPY